MAWHLPSPDIPPPTSPAPCPATSSPLTCPISCHPLTPHALPPLSPLQKQLLCSVHHISFSAHADFEQTSGFLDLVRPPSVVLVHGEVTEMGRLKGALERGAISSGIQRTVFMPRNMQFVQVGGRGGGGEGGRPAACLAAWLLDECLSTAACLAMGVMESIYVCR